MLAPLLLAALPSARPPSPALEEVFGRVLIVARDSAVDPGLAARITELTGGAEALELVVVAAPAEGPPEARTGHVAIAGRDPARPDEPELAEVVRAASVVSLSGGSFLAWYETLLPATGPTRLAETLRRLMRNRTHVVAYGAAASFAAGATMIEKRVLDRPQRNPRDVHPFTSVLGLSLGPPAIVDAEGWPVGDCLELARALHDTKVDLGLFLSGEVALAYDIEPHEVRCIGPGAAVVVDLDTARRQKRAVRAGRMALLADGDRWTFGHWRVLPAEGRELRGTAPASTDDAEPARPEPVHIERFDPRAALEALAQDPGQPLAFALREYRILLRADGATEVRRDAQGRWTVTGAAFDLEWE